MIVRSTTQMNTAVGKRTQRRGEPVLYWFDSPPAYKVHQPARLSSRSHPLGNTWMTARIRELPGSLRGSMTRPGKAAMANSVMETETKLQSSISAQAQPTNLLHIISVVRLT